MKRNFDLLTLGEILLRLSPPNNERLVRGKELNKQVGGAKLNVACGTALLGLRTGIISKLPHHDLGIYVKNRVRFSGVGDDYLVYDQEKSARLGVYYYENGAYPRKPNIVYDRSHTSIGKIALDDFREEIYENARIFHTTGITLALGQNCPAIWIVKELWNSVMLPKLLKIQFPVICLLLIAGKLSGSFRSIRTGGRKVR